VWKKIVENFSGAEYQGKKFKSSKEMELYVECIRLGDQITSLLPEEHTTVSYRKHGVCPKRFSWLQLRVNEIKYTIDDIKHTMTREHFEDYYELFSFLIFKWNQENISPVVLEE